MNKTTPKEEEMLWLLTGKFKKCENSTGLFTCPQDQLKKDNTKDFLHALFRHPWTVLCIPSALEGVNSAVYCCHKWETAPFLGAQRVASGSLKSQKRLAEDKQFKHLI